MSQNDVRRFFVTLQQDPDLAAVVRAQPSFEAVLSVARMHGYEITPGCVIAYLCRLTADDAQGRATATEPQPTFLH